MGHRMAAAGRRLHVPRPSSPRTVRRRATERRQADELLLAGTEADGSAFLHDRAAQLTSPGSREVLARSLDATVRELDGRVLPSAVPLNRAAARPQADLIRALSARLRASDPVTPRGVLLVQELLTDGNASPLYNHDRAADLRPALERALTSLEPRERVAA